MNYTQPVIQNFPYDNPYTKVALGVGLVWGGFLAVRYAMFSEQTPMKRKTRANFTSNQIDNDIDHRNRVYGGPVPANPSIPFYSRNNYNRRRRSPNMW